MYVITSPRVKGCSVTIRITLTEGNVKYRNAIEENIAQLLLTYLGLMQYSCYFLQQNQWEKMHGLGDMESARTTLPKSLLCLSTSIL